AGDVDDDAEKWPAAAQLQGSGLLGQNLFIRSICRDAIKTAERGIVVEDAWPEIHNAAEYRRRLLMRAAKGLQTSDARYAEVRARIKVDEDFVRIIGKWVVDRLPHARGPVRLAALDHIAVFQLGVEDGCIRRVKYLLDSETYVYPGHWEKDEAGEPVWIVKGHQAYLNTAIIQILRATFFSSQNALGHRHMKEYTSSHPTRLEPELTVQLVALAATGIHAALDCWRDGNYIKRKNEKFDGETYKTVYERHIVNLIKIRTDHANFFHSLMSEIYVKVVYVFSFNIPIKIIDTEYDSQRYDCLTKREQDSRKCPGCARCHRVR
ncbi:hypothetical protein HYPSUDRAFT_151966, partial [Hypholoma sublateritium FD-334 SS-4]